MATLFGGTDDFLVTRELAAMATDQQKLEIVDCLFAVAAADQSVRVIETNEIAKIGKRPAQLAHFGEASWRAHEMK